VYNKIIRFVFDKIGYSGNQQPEVIITDSKLFCDNVPVSACFKSSIDTIYISKPHIIKYNCLYNAGLSIEQSICALLAHELTHFVQKYNGTDMTEITVNHAGERRNLSHPLEDYANKIGCDAVKFFHGIELDWRD